MKEIRTTTLLIHPFGFVTQLYRPPCKEICTHIRLISDFVVFVSSLAPKAPCLSRSYFGSISSPATLRPAARHLGALKVM